MGDGPDSVSKLVEMPRRECNGPSEPPLDRQVSIFALECERLTLVNQLLRLEIEAQQVKKKIDAVTAKKDHMIGDWEYANGEWSRPGGQVDDLDGLDGLDDDYSYNPDDDQTT